MFICFGLALISLVGCLETNNVETQEPSVTLVETSTQPIFQAGSVFRELIIDGLVFSFASGEVTSWTEVDLTSFGIPAAAHMAVVAFETNTVGGFAWQVPPYWTCFRRPGEAALTNESNWFYFHTPDPNAATLGHGTIFIPLTGGKFEYMKRWRTRCDGKLVGYYINPAD